MGHSKIKMTERSANLRGNICQQHDAQMSKYLNGRRQKLNVRDQMFAYCSREVNFSPVLTIGKLLEGVVARDGIEPPTPAFSGPPTESRKWFEIKGSH
jgi:hypothetical protein